MYIYISLALSTYLSIHLENTAGLCLRKIFAMQWYCMAKITWRLGSSFDFIVVGRLLSR
jgi:hypothetical protein